MRRSHQITIKDIAKELGISYATVSRAMRNTHDVSEETRNLVLKKAKELNYRVNLNATGLVTNKTRNIGVIVPTITNYYFSTVFTGIQNIAYDKGYNVVLYVTGESTEREISTINSLSLSSIDGLLVCVTEESLNCSHLSNIIDAGIPIVFFDRVAEKINTSKVVQNDYDGAMTAVKHLIEQGYKRIAHITGSRKLSLTKERFQGYNDTIKKYKLEFREEWLTYSEFTQESGYRDIWKLWDYKYKPDAIFAVNDRKAIGAMVALKERGVQIGKEVGVVGFTNDPMASIVTPSLTTIEEPAFKVGEKACDLLLKHILKKNFIPERVVLNGKLFVRESTQRKLY